MRPRRRIILPLVAALFVLSCLAGGAFALYKALVAVNFGQFVKQTASDFDDMFELRSDLLEKFQAEDISIQILNNHVLVVTLTNTPYSDNPLDKQRSIALAIARVSAASFQSQERIDIYRITFVRQRGILGFTAFGSVDFDFASSEVREQ